MAELTRPLRSSFRSAEKTGGRRYSFQLMPAASVRNDAGSEAKLANEEASIGAHSPGVEPECIDPKSDFTKGLGMSFLCVLIGLDRSLPTLHVRLLKASPAICFAAIAPEFVVEARLRALAGVDLHIVVWRSFRADGQGVARDQHRGGNGLKQTIHGFFGGAQAPLGLRSRPKSSKRRGYSGALPNSAAKRFSPVRVKLTTRLPGVGSRAAQFNSVKRLITAAPSVPAR